MTDIDKLSKYLEEGRFFYYEGLTTDAKNRVVEDYNRKYSVRYDLETEGFRERHFGGTFYNNDGTSL